MMWVHWVLAALLVVQVHPLSLDSDASIEVIRASSEAKLTNGEIALVVRGGNGKASRREQLLHVKGEGDDTLSLFYSRKNNRVILETTHVGHIKSTSWGTHSHPGTLVLVLSDSRVQLYANCERLESHSLVHFKDLLSILSHQKLKLYHEDKAPIEVYSSEDAALDGLSCPGFGSDKLDEMTPESDMVEIKDYMSKRHVGDSNTNYLDQMQSDGYMIGADQRDNRNVIGRDENRGDIPLGIESCDDILLREIRHLRTLVEALRGEVAAQKGAIDGIRAQLDQCCHSMGAPRCTGNSCYKG